MVEFIQTRIGIPLPAPFECATPSLLGDSAHLMSHPPALGGGARDEEDVRKSILLARWRNRASVLSDTDEDDVEAVVLRGGFRDIAHEGPVAGRASRVVGHAYEDYCHHVVKSSRNGGHETPRTAARAVLLCNSGTLRRGAERPRHRALLQHRYL